MESNLERIKSTLQNLQKIYGIDDNSPPNLFDAFENFKKAFITYIKNPSVWND